MVWRCGGGDKSGLREVDKFVKDGIIKAGRNKIDGKEDNDILILSSKFINPNESLYKNADKIKPIEGYDDIVCHGSPEGLIINGMNNEEWIYTAKEAAEMIRNSQEFKGRSIRLISCQTGANGINSVAQQIADELGVEVMAPTEIVTVEPVEGKMFVSDNDILTRLWIRGENVSETGKWVIFKPRKVGE